MPPAMGTMLATAKSQSTPWYGGQFGYILQVIRDQPTNALFGAFEVLQTGLPPYPPV